MPASTKASYMRTGELYPRQKKQVSSDASYYPATDDHVDFMAVYSFFAACEYTPAYVCFVLRYSRGENGTLFG